MLEKTTTEQSAARRFISRYASFAGARIALVIGRWFVLVQSARLLPAKDFAALAAALSVAEIVRAVSDIGVDSFVYSRLGGPSGQLSPIVRTALLARVLTSTVMLSMAVFLWLSTGQNAAVVPVFFIILAAPAQGSGVALLQKAAVFRKLSTLVAITFIASLAVDAATLLTKPTQLLMALFLVTPDVVAGFAALSLAAYSVRLELKAAIASRRNPWRILRPAVGKLLPSAMIAIIVMAYGRLDVVVIRPLLGADAQADFSAGFRVIEPFFLFFAIGALALLVELGTKHRNTSADFSNRLASLSPISIFSVLALAAAIATVSVNFFATRFVGLNPRAACVAALLASAIPLRIVNTLITTLLQKFGRFDYVMKAAIINGGLIIGITAAFSYTIGFPAVAASTLCGELITFFVLKTMLTNQRERLTGLPSPNQCV